MDDLHNTSAQTRQEDDDGAQALPPELLLPVSARGIELSRYATKTTEYWARVARDRVLRAGDDDEAVGGRVRLQRIVTDFYNSLEQWQSYQIDVFKMMLNCNLLFVLAGDEDCLEAVMQEYDWSEIPGETFVMAYRGSGKSSVVCAAAAAFIRNIPNYTATMYAVNTRKAEDNLDMIVNFCRAQEEQRPTNRVYRKARGAIRVSYEGGDNRWILACSTFGMVRPTSLFARSTPHTLCRRGGSMGNEQQKQNAVDRRTAVRARGHRTRLTFEHSTLPPPQPLCRHCSGPSEETEHSRDGKAVWRVLTFFAVTSAGTEAAQFSPAAPGGSSCGDRRPALPFLPRARTGEGHHVAWAATHNVDRTE